MTVPEYVNECVKEGTIESLEEAVRLAPTNGLALARLAHTRLAQAQSTLTQVGEAVWYSQRAVTFAPAEAEAHWARAEALERTGKFLEALEEIKGGLEIQPRNPELWHAQGRMLERTGHDDEAYQSLTKAIELATAGPGATNQPHTAYYSSRSQFLRRQNRLEEAAADFRVAKGIQTRDPQAAANLIDLSLYYNVGLTESWHPGNGTSDLSELPRGIQILAGVQFDVRGLIQVGDESRTGEKYPTQVTDIAVQHACQRLQFLHAAIDAGGIPDNTQIGSYVIHYSNGEQAQFPIVIGVSLADWFTQPDEEKKPFTIAWSGYNAESRRQGTAIRLFKSTWQNPAPAESIRSIDFVSSMPSGPAPFLVAVTAEP